MKTKETEGLEKFTEKFVKDSLTTISTFDSIVRKEFMETITKKPKNKKEEQKQINTLLFYLRTKNKK